MELSYEELVRAKQIEALKRKILASVLTSEARSRLARVRLAHPELAQRVELAIIQAAQSGQISKITDAKLKNILATISQKRQFKILR